MGLAVSSRFTAAGIVARRKEAELPARVRRWFTRAHEEANKLLMEQSAGKRLGLRSSASIIKEIADRHKLMVEDLKGPSVKVSYVIARHHAIYEVRRLCPHLSTVQIGHMFGGRDHSSVIKALERWPARAAKANIPVEPLETTNG